MRERGSDPADTRLRRRGLLIVALIFMADGLLRTGYFHFGALSSGRDLPLLDSLISELTGSFAALLGFVFFVVPASRRWPLRGPGWPRRLPPHVLALIAYSIGKTLLMWGSRSLLFPLAGLGAYDYGAMPYRFAMEFSGDVVWYALFVAAVHAWDAWRDAKERELREARLEASLGAARMQALQAQLQPHFLFNTLNAISSVMYADPEQADRLISRLSDLLRSSLAAPHRPEVSLEEELRLVTEYVEIMRARFGERLSFSVTVDDAAAGARVPVFLLQPLVENAIQHGVARRADAGSVEVRVMREHGQLVLRVLDDGPGPGSGTDASPGVGLGNTRERLHHLHGGEASVGLERRPGGGAIAEVRLPFALATADDRDVPALDGELARA